MESAYEGKVEKLLLIACRQAAGETSGLDHVRVHIRAGCALLLVGEVRLVVTVSALEGVALLEALPFAPGQSQPVRCEFLGRVDGASDLTPDFLGGDDLANDFVRPPMRNMAVGAARAYSGAIAVVDALGVRRIDVVLHRMAADAELFGTPRLHRVVEGAHVADSRQEKEHCNDSERHRAATSKKLPKSCEDGWYHEREYVLGI